MRFKNGEIKSISNYTGRYQQKTKFKPYFFLNFYWIFIIRDYFITALFHIITGLKPSARDQSGPKPGHAVSGRAEKSPTRARPGPNQKSPGRPAGFLNFFTIF